MDFFKRYNEIFGMGAFDKLLSVKRSISRNEYIRVNISKISVEEAEEELKKIRVKTSRTFIDNCLLIERSFFNVNASPMFLNGYLYSQDIASQIPIYGLFQYLKNNISLFKGKKLKVLDISAAPGSKTTQLADYLKYLKIDYEIVALDSDEKRVISLVNNIQKQGFDNIDIFNVNAEKYFTRDKFDIILADVPCSGNLITDDGWLKKRDMQGINGRANIQRDIVANVVNFLKKDGILVYSTCSLEPEENEDNVDWIIRKKKFQIFSPCKFSINSKSLKSYKNKQYSKDIVDNSIRLIPFISQTQGFFVSYLRKK